MAGFNSLSQRTKNLLFLGGLTGFVFGIYFYTMRAVGSVDEVQVAINRLEEEKRQKEAKEAAMSKA